MNKLVFLAAFLLTLPTAAAHAQLVSIGTLGGNNSVGTSINAAGQVVGRSETTTDPSTLQVHAFLWTPTTPNGMTGTMIDLGVLGGANSAAHGINDLGQVVGKTNTETDGDRAFVWTPSTLNGSVGTMVSIGTLGGSANYANAINNAGQVVGASHFALDNPFDLHAFLWTPDEPNGSTGVMIDLGTLGGASSVARAISADGKVVGWSDTAGGPKHAFLWTPGGTAGPPSNPQMQDLGTLDGDSESEGFGVNSLGQVAGGSYNGFYPRAFLWTPGGTAGSENNPQLQNLGHLGGGMTLATGLTETGAVTGFSLLTANVSFNAFIWVPEAPNVTSGTLIDVGAVVPFGGLISINASGQLAGYAQVTADAAHAFVMAPYVPNQVPTADDQSVTVTKDKSQAVTLTGSDADGDALTYIVLTSPAHGTLTGSGTSLTYTPARGYIGPDSFTFKVNDGAVDSDTATVSITVAKAGKKPPRR